jgi:hypothetical protein
MQQEFLSALNFRDKATVEKRGDTKQTTASRRSSVCISAKTKLLKAATFLSFVFLCVQTQSWNAPIFLYVPMDGKKEEKEAALKVNDAPYK